MTYQFPTETDRYNETLEARQKKLALNPKTDQKTIGKLFPKKEKNSRKGQKK